MNPVAPAEGYTKNDNCLINPGLSVAKSQADTSGQQMDYWPAYERMRPSSRLALLAWLSGDRADPSAYIGYVFVYLYGLERRAVLDGAAEDRPAIRAEVGRLLGIYGHHGSFRRYGGDLLSGLDILGLDPERDTAPVYAPSGGDVPAAVRIAVGRRIREGRPIEAEWLLAWTMAHPETRVRTPARRAFEQLEDLFASEVAARYPGGVPVTGDRRAGSSAILYRAASGTFTVDLGEKAFGPLPDISRYPEPLAAGRAILESCTAKLDAYSRFVGRTPGQAVTLQAVALLPPDQRERALERASSEPLGWLAALASEGKPVPFSEVTARVFGNGIERATPGKLRDVADTLCRFGYGLVPDPRFPTKAVDPSTVTLLRSMTQASRSRCRPTLTRLRSWDCPSASSWPRRTV